MQGHPICYPDFAADLSFRMRLLWRDIADMSPLEGDNKPVIFVLGMPVPS